MTRTLSRREFLKGGIGVLGVLGLLTASSRAILQRIAPWNISLPFIHPYAIQILERLDQGDFMQHLGDAFGIRRGSAQLARLTLDKVEGLGQNPSRLEGTGEAGSDEEVFSLVFRGSRIHPITQDTYTLAHETIGEFPLFLVPIYPDASNAYYEAIIDRRHAG